jgi:mannose-6-phosphate isomerase-like protein (cupin superfamily)
VSEPGEVRGYVVGAGQGVTDHDPELKASRASTGGALTLIESDTTGGAPLHVHRDEDECFYVLEGSITVRCGDEGFEADRRSFVFLPRGVPHSWDVVGDRAVVLIITVPGGFEEFMREYHEAEPARRNEVAARHGIEMLGG